MKYELLRIDNLSQSVFIGFWLFFIGLIFTGVMFYFVFYRLNQDFDSYKDRERRKLENENQKNRIAKLYPKGN